MFSFKLNDDFVDQYRPRPVPWGFTDVAGNSFSELTFLDKYSRVKDDGSKETWVDVCARVTNGTYSIQKDHAKGNRLPWNDHKAQRSAQEFFERMFHFKFTPPGRGLWVMGTDIVNVQRNSAALQNCAFTSTKGMSKLDPAAPFRFLMEASMLGVGVGFDTLGTKKGFVIQEVDVNRGNTPQCTLGQDGRALGPSIYSKNNSFERQQYYLIPDTRQGWVESTALVINVFLRGGTLPIFDYSAIRPRGEVIRTFGGTAAGPLPLWELHTKLIELFRHRAGEPLTSLDIVDIGNLIGVCVVSGNVRRSAELALGEDGDELFMKAKDWQANPARTHYCPDDENHDWVDGTPCPGGRAGWGYMSNNSIAVHVGTDYQPYIENIVLNGEPGFAWMDITRNYGRIIDGPDGKDWRADGFNPCFHPDTIIETVDGPRRIADITQPTLVYTRDHDGKLSTGKASAAWKTRQGADTVEIKLRNGDSLIVTPEHNVMLRGGAWVMAKDLKPNDALETLNRTRRGWRYSGVRLASQPHAEQVMEHRFIWEATYGPIPDDYDVDHINRDHHDNRIENLRLFRHDEHARLSRSQVPNNHQVHGPDGDFAPSGNHGVKLASGAIKPPRSTDWVNQFTVVEVVPGPITDVYDITVDDTHCMIANGVVAHNCAEQPLEGGHNGQGECCTLVETYLPRHESIDDFKRTLKFAYLYAKTVTLLPTHWDETNSIMQRNRRIGTSISGVAEFADLHSMSELKTYLNQGYDTIRYYDRKYSEWLCVRESIRVTTVKPSGTVSLLAGVTPGAHWMPGGTYFLRAQRLDAASPLVPMLQVAGYTVEPDINDARRVVAYFPIHHPGARAESEVTMWEKTLLAVTLQRYWSDNSVSVTVSFNPETEASQVGHLVRAVEGQLKTVSFLPKGNKVYPQQPYTEITQEQYEAYLFQLFPVDFSVLYLPEHARQALGEAYCTTDACLVGEN